MYEKPKICTECGGKCCNNMPGVAWPADFGLPGPKGESKLREAIKSGDWCLDTWEGDPRKSKDVLNQCWFVRPATKGNEHTLIDRSWGGVCIFLDEDHCRLAADDRPMACQLLEPKRSGCINHAGVYGNGKQQAAVKWIPYQDLLTRIIEEQGAPTVQSPQEVLFTVLEGLMRF